MRKPAYIFLIILPLLSSCRSPRITPSEIPSNVSAQRFEEFHRSLFVADGNSRGFTHRGPLRYPAYEHDAAKAVIASSFKQMGYITRIDPFSFYKFEAVYTNCANVVAIKPGTHGHRIHIIGAHYDTVDAAHGNITRCPGADDNGSGVAALLETARVLQQETFRDTLVFVAFDAEEKGSYQSGEYGSPGAHHFIHQYLTTEPSEAGESRFILSSIVGMISIDMIGYDDPASPPYVVIGRKRLRGSSIGDDLEEAAEVYSGLLPRQAWGYDQSDHRAFHRAGIDAVHLIEYDLKDYSPSRGPSFTENPHYHSDTDSIDTPNYISYAYASEITKCIVGYLCDQAGLLEPQTTGN